MTPLPQGYYMRRAEADAWEPCAEVALAHIVGRDECRTIHDILYIDAAGGEHLAGAGTITDGGSKPRWTWAIFGHPFDRHYLRAYVVHDAECDAAWHIYGIDRDRGRLLRLHADRTFRRGVRWLGAGPWRAASYYRAVRVGAWWQMG